MAAANARTAVAPVDLMPAGILWRKPKTINDL
jgi:hypothetical protein